MVGHHHHMKNCSGCSIRKVENHWSRKNWKWLGSGFEPKCCCLWLSSLQSTKWGFWIFSVPLMSPFGSLVILSIAFKMHK